MTNEEVKKYLADGEWGIKKSNNKMIFHTNLELDISMHLSGDFPDAETRYAFLIAIVNKLNKEAEHA